MKLSTKGRYGLRAMIDLAVYSEKGTGVYTEYSGSAEHLRALS